MNELDRSSFLCFGDAISNDFDFFYFHRIECDF